MPRPKEKSGLARVGADKAKPATIDQVSSLIEAIKRDPVRHFSFQHIDEMLENMRWLALNAENENVRFKATEAFWAYVSGKPDFTGRSLMGGGRSASPTVSTHVEVKTFAPSSPPPEVADPQIDELLEMTVEPSKAVIAGARQRAAKVVEDTRGGPTKSWMKPEVVEE